MNAQLIAMCYMCVMMTEIETIEGGQKRCLLSRGDQKLKKIIMFVVVKFWSSSNVKVRRCQFFSVKF